MSKYSSFWKPSSSFLDVKKAAQHRLANISIRDTTFVNLVQPIRGKEGKKKKEKQEIINR